MTIMRQHFKIVNIKGNSVRVTSGIVTFDVLVLDEGRIKVPDQIFIPGREDFIRLVQAVQAAYDNNISGDNKHERSSVC